MNINKKFLSDLDQTFKSKKYQKTGDFRSFLVDEKISEVNSLSKAFNEPTMSLRDKVLLKEKLYTIMNIKENALGWKSYMQTFAAGFMALALVFTSVFDYGDGIETANASSPISISAVSGEVKVIRLGKELLAYPGFNVNPSDRIMTDGGFVEMIFADKSIMRLDSNSEIVIDDVDNFSGKTDSSMTVKRGSLWFNAFGGADRLSEYNFKTAEMLIEVDDDSVINLEVNDLFGQVAVFGESAEVNYKNKGQFQTSVLRKGDLIKVKKEQDSISVVDTVLMADDLKINQRTWYLDNMKKDRLYEESLVETSILASKDKVKVTPDSLWYPLKEAQRAAKLALTVDPVRKAEVELEIADEKLHEARILSVEGKKDLAKKTIDAYQKNLGNVLDIASKVETDKKDVEGSAKLKNDAKVLVENHKREILAEDKEDDIKEALLNTELKVAEASGEKVKVKLKQLDEEIDKITSVDTDLVVDDNTIEQQKEKVNKVVVDFTETLKEAQMSGEELDEDLSKLIQERVIDLSELVDEDEAPVLKDKIKEIGIEIDEEVSEESEIVEEDVIKTKIELDELENEVVTETENSSEEEEAELDGEENVEVPEVEEVIIPSREEN